MSRGLSLGLLMFLNTRVLNLFAVMYLCMDLALEKNMGWIIWDVVLLLINGYIVIEKLVSD